MKEDIFLPSFSIGDLVYEKIPQIVEKSGKKIVIIGGKTALSKALDKILLAICKSDLQVLGTFWYGGEASYTNVDKLLSEDIIKNADMIFGVGGGKALDTCKILSSKLEKTLYNFPTIASTCASVSSVCAVYQDNKEFLGVFHRQKPAEHSFIDTKIIAQAPSCYLHAGMGDTIAKAYEPEFSSRNDKLDFANRLGILISSLCVTPILSHGIKALEDNKNHAISESLNEVILSIIVNTGLVSNLINHEYNSCVAHALCYGFTAISEVEEAFLHGQIVSYGVLVELMLEDRIDEIKQLYAFYKKINLPTSYKTFGIQKEQMQIVFQKAMQVNDLKTAAFKISMEDLKKAVEKLEAFSF